MSEKEISQLILERIDQLEKKLLSTEKPTSTTSEHESKRNHATIEEIESCPNCSEKFKLKDYNDKKKAALEAELRPILLKEVKEKLKSKELLTCDGCGEIVEKTVDECPTCKGTRAH